MDMDYEEGRRTVRLAGCTVLTEEEVQGLLDLLQRGEEAERQLVDSEARAAKLEATLLML